MTEDQIILEIILDRTTGDSRIAQLCTDITNSYFSQVAQANTPYTFGWGPNGTDLGDPVKITVGSVAFLLEFDAVDTKVKLIGTCNSTEWNHFYVSGQTLQYDNGTFQFSTDCQLLGGTSVEITIEVASTSSIIAMI